MSGYVKRASARRMDRKGMHKEDVKSGDRERWSQAGGAPWRNPGGGGNRTRLRAKT